MVTGPFLHLSFISSFLTLNELLLWSFCRDSQGLILIASRIHIQVLYLWNHPCFVRVELIFGGKVER